MSLSPEAELVAKWGKAFQDKDLSVLENLLDKKYQHFYYPKSLNMPTLDKEQFIGVLRKMFLTWKSSVVSYLCC